MTPGSLFSPIFLQGCSVSLIHESGSDNPFQRYGHSKFSKMAGDCLLDLVQPEVGPIEPPTSKTPYPRTKHEVDRMTRCRDMAVRIFPKCEVGRWSVVGPHCSHVLLFATLGTKRARTKNRYTCRIYSKRQVGPFKDALYKLALGKRTCTKMSHSSLVIDSPTIYLINLNLELSLIFPFFTFSLLLCRLVI